MAKEKQQNWFLLLPHYYRIITERFIKKPIFPAILLFSVFLASFFLVPQSRFWEAKRKIFQNPQDLSAHLVLLDELILASEFEKAETEISFLEANYFKLTNEGKEQFWQKNLFLREQDPIGREGLIKNWQQFLEKNPDYKIGWLALAYYQQKAGHKDRAQTALKKAYELDPGLTLDYPSLFSSATF